MTASRFDVVVVGAGPAGLACARACVAAGLRTRLLDRRPRDALGHPCVVEVLTDTLDACDVAWSASDTVFHVAEDVKVLAPSRREIFRLHHPDTEAFRLDHFVASQLATAEQEGVGLVAPAVVHGPLMDGKRVVGVRVDIPEAGDRTIEARMVVDATGNRSELIRQLPRSCGVDFSDRSRDSVLAESRVYALDASALASVGARRDWTADLVHHELATQGTYSTLSYLVDSRRGRVFLLAGIKQENTPPGASAALDDLADRLGVCGELLFAGSGRIRIRRASLRFVCDGFAAVGEAAGMVVPMHASGVGQGLLAGKALGEHLAAVSKDGFSTQALWPWLARYQRGLGAIMASYDANRRFLESLDVEEGAIPLLESGLMQAEDMQATLLSRPLTVSPRSWPSRLAGVLRHPRLTAKLARAAPRLRWVRRHWERFPTHWHAGSYRRWRVVAERLLP